MRQSEKESATEREREREKERERERARERNDNVLRVPCKQHFEDIWCCSLDCGRLTYLVVELRELHLHLVPLEVVILSLLTYWWDQVKLTRH